MKTVPVNVMHDYCLVLLGNWNLMYTLSMEGGDIICYRTHVASRSASPSTTASLMVSRSLMNSFSLLLRVSALSMFIMIRERLLA